MVRLDFAVDVADIKNQFREGFTQLAFSLPMTVCVTQDLLVGLNSWLRLRKVYLNRIEVMKYFVGWDDVFLWCRNSLNRLHIVGTESGNFCQNTSHFLNTALVHCQILEELSVENCGGQNVETLGIILRNNASTLVVLIVKNMRNRTVHLDDISCPRLQVLFWENDFHVSLSAFLQRCPNLYALALDCGGITNSETLVSALAESRLALKRLRLSGMNVFDSNKMLRIARGCNQLEYFELGDYDEYLSENIVEIMQELPYLHTLETDDFISEAKWLEIAVRGLAPSLRVLDVNTEFTCTGFRQFTSAYPYLTGLRLIIRDMNFNVDSLTFLEHCTEMQHLVLQLSRISLDVVEELLESVALCCPRLEILELTYMYVKQCNTSALQLVLDKCSHLKFFVMGKYDAREHLRIPLGVTVLDQGPPLAQWMPANVINDGACYQF